MPCPTPEANPRASAHPSPSATLAPADPMNAGELYRSDSAPPRCAVGELKRVTLAARASHTADVRLREAESASASHFPPSHLPPSHLPPPHFPPPHLPPSHLPLAHIPPSHYPPSLSAHHQSPISLIHPSPSPIALPPTSNAHPSPFPRTLTPPTLTLLPTQRRLRGTSPFMARRLPT